MDNGPAVSKLYSNTLMASLNSRMNFASEGVANEEAKLSRPLEFFNTVSQAYMGTSSFTIEGLETNERTNGSTGLRIE
ncbi:hypothetical protein JR316_0006446 [Psilocybe cubensis]|uniref:Uncharacterized protein n=1 Tax=Psilocybe cubensis TaxID=181762 RepID=A0ACB8H345_PSICU|nr:hypothetical protein JR316_0006446 [Psilocybe cubensis]KAH9481916.1 hypothetical protein JR316_0006446 [Psilocybe cubensis]